MIPKQSTKFFVYAGILCLWTTQSMSNTPEETPGESPQEVIAREYAEYEERWAQSHIDYAEHKERWTQLNAQQFELMDQSAALKKKRTALEQELGKNLQLENEVRAISRRLREVSAQRKQLEQTQNALELKKLELKQEDLQREQDKRYKEIQRLEEWMTIAYQILRPEEVRLIQSKQDELDEQINQLEQQVDELDERIKQLADELNKKLEPLKRKQKDLERQKEGLERQQEELEQQINIRAPSEEGNVQFLERKTLERELVQVKKELKLLGNKLKQLVEETREVRSFLPPLLPPLLPPSTRRIG